MNDNQLIKLTSGLKSSLEPRPEWLKKSRHLLLAELEDKKTSLWQRLIYNLVPQNFIFKPVAVYGLIAGLFLMSSFATVNASKNTLPGSPLYIVKTSAEKVRYFLTFSAESKARMGLDLAQRRAGEFKVLMFKNNLAASTDGKKVSLQIAQELDNVKNNLNKIKEDGKDNTQVLEVVQLIDKKVVALKDDLAKVENTDPALNVDAEVKNALAKTDDIKVMVLAVLNDLEKNKNNEQVSESGVVTSTAESLTTPVEVIKPTSTPVEEWKLEREKIPVPEVKEFTVQLLQ